MNERRIRFSVPTDDIERSVSLYRDALGLAMRPICNPIAMFPLGEAELEICHREKSKELLGFEFSASQCTNLLISLVFDTQEEARRAEAAALNCGAVARPGVGSPLEKCFQDFNGVNWHLSSRR